MLPWHVTHNPEYRTSKGWRIFIYLTAPLLIALFLYTPFVILSDKHPSIGFSLGSGILGVGMAGLMAYGLSETVRWKFIIDQWQVSETGTFKTKALALAEIKGYRRDDKYTRIYPIQKGGPVIKIGYTTERYDEIRHWLAGRYPDLDELETQQATETLLADTTLGETEESRAMAVARAQRVARALNIGGMAVAAWLWFYPQPYDWAIAMGLLLPLLAITALWIFPRTLRIDEKKNSGYPSVLAGFLIGSLILLLRAMFDYEIVNYATLWPVVGAMTAGIATAMAIGNRKFLAQPDSRVSVALTILLLAALYGFGATVIVNGEYDDSPATVFTPKVSDKHISSGKTTTYYLTLQPWGPITASEDTPVSRSYYNEVQVGQAVSVALHAGRLGVPWYKVAEK